jgi:ATP-dependent Clp protease ATP-binding subunit ClpX
MEGVRLSFEREALQTIVKEVKQKRTGARALRSVMERVMGKLMFNIPSQKEVEEVVITKGMVTGHRKPKFLKLKAKKTA